MSQDLTKCTCCGKMVPTLNMELSYRMPDAIASMNDEDIETQCTYTNDYVICEEEYYYIRCVIPLPVLGIGTDYSIGAWAQVSQNSFSKIRELWNNESQVNEAPMQGLLANEVHLNTNVEDIDVEVQLTGPTSRPIITIKDTDSSLYNEQQCGISMHRASEYSDLCR